MANPHATSGAKKKGLRGWFSRRSKPQGEAEATGSATGRGPATAPRAVEAPAKEWDDSVEAWCDRATVRAHLIERLVGLGDKATRDGDRRLLGLIQELVENDALDLPRFPMVARKLLDLGEDTDLDNSAIAGLVARDQDVSGQVIKIASSAMYGATPVRSLEQAVSRLGLPLVRQVAIGSSAQGAVYKAPGYEEHAKQIRVAGLRSGLLAVRLCRRFKLTSLSGYAFLSGLFHDVGEVLVLRTLSQLREKGGEANPALVRMLVRSLHTELGVYYGIDRALPRPVLAATAFHHRPEEAVVHARPLAWLVWTTDQADEVLERKHEAGADGALAKEWPRDAPSLGAVIEEVEALKDSASGLF